MKPAKRIRSEKALGKDSLIARRSREKAASRKRDHQRLASGKATPEQIQRENSIFSDEWIRNVTLENLTDVAGR